MKKIRLVLTVVMAGAALGTVVTGCANHADGSSTLAQQKAGVMGGPAPASEQAKIAALQAANSQRASQGQKAPAAGQPANK